MKYIITALILLIKTSFAMDCNSSSTYNIIMDASDRVSTWKQLVIYYDKYGACDEGEIADQNTAVMEQLFQNSWKSLWTSKIIENNPQVWEFVLKHISDSWVTSPEHWFYNQVNFQCPEKYADVCARMKKRAQGDNPPTETSLYETNTESSDGIMEDKTEENDMESEGSLNE